MPILKRDYKYIFVGGKGGVGKTVIASAIALDLAERGRKVLLASFNPVHSLSTLFQQDLSGGVVKKIKEVESLYAVEVEIDDIVNRYKEKISRIIREFLKWAEIPIDPKGFIDIATTNPAFQESAMFDKMMDIVLNEGQNYDNIVFDTAAVANAIRLIGLSKIYGLWLGRVIKSREEALSLRYQLSFRKDKVLEEIKKDPLLLDLLSLDERYNEVKKILTNPNITTFVFVTISTILAISVVKRFSDMVMAHDIPIGGVVVNMVIPREEAEKDLTGFLRSKWEEQERNIRLIKELFGENVLGYVPMFPTDVIGIEALKMIIDVLKR
jgi:arsenite-transporting ATPase